MILLAKHYPTVTQTLYLMELTGLSFALFLAGYLLLGSKRPKDAPNRWYGWVFYGMAFIMILVMWVMVRYYE